MMVENKNFNELTEKELKEIKHRILSLYPMLYHKISRFKEINFTFINKNIEKAFNKLMSFNTLDSIENIHLINKTSKNIIINTFMFPNVLTKSSLTIENKKFYEDIDFKSKIIDLSKVFFALNYNLKNYFVPTRNKLLKNNRDNLNTEKIIFSHDGWWNNYYIKIIDNESRKLLEKEIKNKKELRRKDAISYIRTFLTYAYRLVEIEQFKKAYKMIKKKRHFMLLRLFKDFYKNSFYYTGISTNVFKKVKSILAISKLYYNRYNTNYLMFMYRTSKNKKKKIKIIKKMNRVSNYLNVINNLNKTKLVSNIISVKENLIRPQQILKMIEFNVDLYVLYEGRKQKQKDVQTYINFLLIEFSKCLYYNFYDLYNSPFLYYSIMNELFFVLFYIMENIYKINIQEY